MFVAGIDAHATYSVICVVSNGGQLVHGPVRIKNAEADRLTELLEPVRPLEVVVETSPVWPWLFDRLHGHGVHLVLAHAKRLRVIAESNYKRDDIDAEILARMRLAGLLPEVQSLFPGESDSPGARPFVTRFCRSGSPMQPAFSRRSRCSLRGSGTSTH